MDTAGPAADWDPLDGLLRLSGQDFYLLIAITPEELRSLRTVHAASWEDRKSIKAGTALGHSVFWCRSSEDPTEVTLVVGADDEVWELSLKLPGKVIAGVLPPA